MKKALLTFLCFCCIVFNFQTLSAQSATTNDAKNLLGIRISTRDAVINHSVTYKRFLDPTLALEGLFSFGDPAALGLLLEKHTPLGASGLSWFWGAGAYAGFGGSRRFGAQGIVGLDFLPKSLPFNLSVDWKPELNITRVFSFEPAAIGISARYIF